MIELEDLFLYIQEILIPIAMISGIGIISLLTQTRYGRVVDITRQLDHEKFSLFSSKVSRNLVESEQKISNHRINNIDTQIDLLIKRGSYLKRALTSLLTGVFAFIFTSLLILLQETFPITILVPITAVSFIMGMALLVTGGLLIIVDLTLSQKAVITSIEGTKEIMKSFEK